MVILLYKEQPLALIYNVMIVIVVIQKLLIIVYALKKYQIVKRIKIASLSASTPLYCTPA